MIYYSYSFKYYLLFVAIIPIILYKNVKKKRLLILLMTTYSKLFELLYFDQRYKL